MKYKNFIVLFALQAIVGLTFPLIRMVLWYGQPFFSAGIRQLIAGILMLLFVVVVQKKSLKLSQQKLMYVLRFGFFTAFLCTVLEFWAMQFIISAKTSFLYKFAPIAGVIFSYLHFGQKVTWKKMVGLALAIGGFFPVLMSDAPAEELAGGIGWLSWPEIAILFGTVAMVYGWSNLRLAVKDGVSPLLANGIGMSLAGILSLVLSALTETWHPVVTNVWPFIGIVLAMVVVGNLISANLYAYLLGQFTTSFLTLSNFLNVVFTAFYGWILLGETVGWMFFASLGIVMSGLLLFYSEEVKQGYIEVQ